MNATAGPELSTAIPPALRKRMKAAVDQAGEPGTSPNMDADLLARAALDRLRLVLASAGDRSSALDLLAADALLTEAIAEAAESGPSALAEFAQEALDRIAALLDGAGATTRPAAP